MAGKLVVLTDVPPTLLPAALRMIAGTARVVLALDETGRAVAALVRHPDGVLPFVCDRAGGWHR